MGETRQILVGVGQMGAVFAHALLRAGVTLVPVRRGDDLEAVAHTHPHPERVLVTVGEADLEGVLSSLPEGWRDRLLLLQNELLPGDWERYGVVDPTVAVVWFEKKASTAVKVIRPTPVAGPGAAHVVGALRGIGIDAFEVPRGRLLFELVAKNLYILTSNLAGLRTGGTVGELWSEHRAFAEAVASEVLDLQEALSGKTLPRDALLEAMVAAFDADPAHACTGRSAPSRLARALSQAERLGIDMPTVRSLSAPT